MPQAVISTDPLNRLKQFDIERIPRELSPELDEWVAGGHCKEELGVLRQLGGICRRLLELGSLGLAHASQVKGALGQGAGLQKYANVKILNRVKQTPFLWHF